MREEAELATALGAATALVSDSVAGRIGVAQFADRYGSFYYFEALDGHEANDADRALFRTHADAIALHEEVQRTVVDLLYRGGEEQRAQYLAAGRIDEREALARLQRLAERYRIA